MTPPVSIALQYVMRDAARLAEELGHRPSTVHHLLHLTTFENPARTLLARYQLTRRSLTLASKGAPSDSPHLMESLRDRCAKLGQKFNSAETDCIHLLFMLCKTPESVAFGVLQAAGADIAEIRRVIVQHLAAGPRVRGLGETVLPMTANNAAGKKTVAEAPREEVNTERRRGAERRQGQSAPPGPQTE